MNVLLPSPDKIPAAWEYFKFLLMSVFPLHLIFMNAMVGSTVIAAYACMRKDETMKKLAHELARTIPFLIAFAVNLGVAALLFLQVLYGTFFYTSSILIGVYWISVIPLLVGAYYAAYLIDFRFLRLGRLKEAIISLSLVIFLCIAFIYSNNMTLMLDPEKWNVYFGHPAGTVLNLGDPALIPRYIHFMIGAFAVGGLFVALFGRFRTTMKPEIRAAAERTGMNMFSFMTGVQIVAGFIFLLSLPRKVMLSFVGGNALATVFLAVGASLALLVFAAGMKRKVYVCAGLVLPLIYIMSFIRDFVRTGYLKPYFSPDFFQMTPQYSPMFMFFVALIAGIAVVAWMLRKARQSFLQAEDKE
jgi:hypothetical protein